MSIDHVSRVLALGPEVSGTERMVAFVLAEAANGDTDECWPKIDTIRKRAGLRQERYVTKAIRALEAAGLVLVTVQGAPDSRIPDDRRPNLYRLIGPLAVTGVRDAQVRGGASRTNGGARRADDGGARRAPLTGIDEPEGEPTTAPAVVDAVRRAANRVVKEWYDARKAQGQAPVQTYIAVVKIVERALRNGVTVNDIAVALAQCPTVTAASLEFTLSKLRGRVGRPPPSASPEAVAMLDAEYRHLAAERAKRANGPPPDAGRALPSGP